ncbi:MAG: hypothetical protein JWO38_7664 [Gemmataceae bacterium]|nr:hypothetical protein [Gemmataceae bacterium]
MPTPGCRRAGAVVLTLPFFLIGCSGADAVPDLHPLTGTVSRDGVPVTSGGLLFEPDAGGRPGLVVNAAVRGDGTFAAQVVWAGREGSEVKPGVPAGRYKVIYHPPGDGSRTGLEVELDQWVTVEPRPNEVAIVLPQQLPGGLGMPRDDNPPAAQGEPRTEK